jgi:hypothetical protein
MDYATRTARVLSTHGLSLPEHFVLCSAGYRVTYSPDAFVEHAFAASEGDRRGKASRSELAAALERLRTRGLLTCLTDGNLREEARRRASSAIPEVIDVGYDAGHVDFTPRGYAVHREVIRAIHGDDHLARVDAGFNLDPEAGRFDVYAVGPEHCRALLEKIEAGGDDYSGVERTRFVERSGPTAIAQWRPNRFVVRATGYHAVLRFHIGSVSVLPLS